MSGFRVQKYDHWAGILCGIRDSMEQKHCTLYQAWKRNERHLGPSYTTVIKWLEMIRVKQWRKAELNWDNLNPYLQGFAQRWAVSPRTTVHGSEILYTN